MHCSISINLFKVPGINRDFFINSCVLNYLEDHIGCLYICSEFGSRCQIGIKREAGQNPALSP